MGRLLLLATCAAALVGCGAGDAGKATEDDKQNLDRLTTEGLKGSPPPPSQGGDQNSVSGKVDPP